MYKVGDKLVLKNIHSIPLGIIDLFDIHADEDIWGDTFIITEIQPQALHCFRVENDRGDFYLFLSEEELHDAFVKKDDINSVRQSPEKPNLKLKLLHRRKK